MLICEGAGPHEYLHTAHIYSIHLFRKEIKTNFVSDLTPQEIHKIREAIKNASSLQEVERLTRMLQSGQIPGQKPLLPPTQSNGQRKICIRYQLLGPQSI